MNDLTQLSNRFRQLIQQCGMFCQRFHRQNMSTQVHTIIQNRPIRANTDIIANTAHHTTITIIFKHTIKVSSKRNPDPHSHTSNQRSNDI